MIIKDHIVTLTTKVVSKRDGGLHGYRYMIYFCPCDHVNIRRKCVEAASNDEKRNTESDQNIFINQDID